MLYFYGKINVTLSYSLMPVSCTLKCNFQVTSGEMKEIQLSTLDAITIFS